MARKTTRPYVSNSGHGFATFKEAVLQDMCDWLNMQSTNDLKMSYHTTGDFVQKLYDVANQKEE